MKLATGRDTLRNLVKSLRSLLLSIDPLLCEVSGLIWQYKGLSGCKWPSFSREINKDLTWSFHVSNVRKWWLAFAKLVSFLSEAWVGYVLGSCNHVGLVKLRRREICRRSRCTNHQGLSRFAFQIIVSISSDFLGLDSFAADFSTSTRSGFGWILAYSMSAKRIEFWRSYLLIHFEIF